MPELQRLRADHAPAVLAFELANRAYFATFISDRGDEFFDHFTERYHDLLAEQEAGTCVFHVLVGEDGTVLGRFNLFDLEDGTAVLGYRVAEHVAGRGVATAAVQELCRLAAARTGCARSEQRPRMTTSRPRRCWPKPGSSLLAPPSPAAGQAPGISVTWPPADPDQSPTTRSSAHGNATTQGRLRQAKAVIRSSGDSV